MLLAIDPHKDFVNVECVTIASVFPLQATGINGSELDTLKTDRFAADGDASFCE